jgi:LysM repeat protein
MRLRAALVAVALLAAVAACGGSAASPSQAPASVAPVASFAVPSAAPPTVEPTVAPTTAPAGGTTYTVKKGDTLWAIALRYKTTIKAIQDANPSLTNPDVLKIGQKLVIPAP